MPSEAENRKWVHDLRTQMNHLAGYSEIMLEEIPAGISQTPFEWLRELNRASQSMAHRLNSVLLSHAEGPYHDLSESMAGIRGMIADHESQVEILGDGAQRDYQRLLDAVGISERMLAQGPQEYAASAEAPAPAPSAANQPALVAQAPLTAGDSKAVILVVDDDQSNREILCRLAQNCGYSCIQAASGKDALQRLGETPVSLVLLDFLMPDMDGLEVLARLREHPVWRKIPVIALSGVHDMDVVIRFVEAGAQDYLTKPFHAQLLRTRVARILERVEQEEYLHVQNQQLADAVSNLEAVQKRARELLLNILPESIAVELLDTGVVEPMYFEDATVVMTDFVGFTSLTARISVEELVDSLHQFFSMFDRIVHKYQLEKLKTIGDAYVYLGGIPNRNNSHPVDALLAALEISKAVSEAKQGSSDWRVRIGVHTGPLISGVVGIQKFAFDVWGDTINLSDRLQKACRPGEVAISHQTFLRVKDFFDCTPKGDLGLADKRAMEHYAVVNTHPSLRQEGAGYFTPTFLKRYKMYFRKLPPGVESDPETTRSAEFRKQGIAALGG